MLIRDDWIIASIFRLIGQYTATPIHWPGTDVSSEDTAWMEPMAAVQRTPMRTTRDYGLITVEANIFQRETTETYNVHKYAGMLGQLLRDAAVEIRNWPDGGAAHVGTVRLFEPVSTPLPITRTGASSNMQQVNVRIEGVFMGDQ